MKTIKIIGEGIDIKEFASAAIGGFVTGFVVGVIAFAWAYVSIL